MKAGFIFMIAGTSVTVRVNVRVNGRVEILETAAFTERDVVPVLAWRDNSTDLVQGRLLQIDEAYFHYLRSTQFVDLCNAEAIERNGSLSIKMLLDG